MMRTFHGADAVDVVVTNNTTARQYEAHVDGELTGVATYVPVADRVVFTHAEVDPQWRHKGVGSALARGALDDVIAAGKLITPKCPFIVGYVRSHPSYLEHVDAHHRAELGATTGEPTDREGT